MSETETNPEERSVVRCRGLPWSTTVDELMSFFSDCQLAEGRESVHMTQTREGRPSGEAYIEMASDADIEKALKKDRQTMGKRYIEVFKAKYSEMEWVLKRSGAPTDGATGTSDNVVRLRGLPFEATKTDIVTFFEGLDITDNGILLTMDYQGRTTGEAFVQFASKEHTEKALEKNKETMGHRYIEVFRSSMMEARQSSNNSGGGGGGGGGGSSSMRPGSGGGSGGSAGPSMAGGRSRSAVRDFSMMRGARMGPYDRMVPQGGPPLGRGYGAYGPNSRGSRSFKSYGTSGPDSFYDGGNGGGGSGGNDGYGSVGAYGRFGMGNSGLGAGVGALGGGGVMTGVGNNMMDNVGAGNSGLGMGYGGRFVVHMRGLPYRVSEEDIAEWFGQVVHPIDIRIIYNNQGRPSGEADVLFASDSEARKAMSKDRHNMQHRYVELFYDGPSAGIGAGGGGGGGGVGGGGHHNGNGAGMPSMGSMGSSASGTGFSSGVLGFQSMMSGGGGNGYTTY